MRGRRGEQDTHRKSETLAGANETTRREKERMGVCGGGREGEEIRGKSGVKRKSGERDLFRSKPQL